jgi:hypothetical protein
MNVVDVNLASILSDLGNALYLGSDPSSLDGH